MRLRKSDGGVVPVRVCNATGGKAITITTALQGNRYHAQ